MSEPGRFYTVEFKITEPDGTVHMVGLQYWPIEMHRLLIMKQVVGTVFDNVEVLRER